MKSLWRIAAETRDYSAADLSGAGAALNPGRWNKAGEAVVYAATSLSLAVLETATNLNPLLVPLNRFVVRISVPRLVWVGRHQLASRKIAAAWRAVPAGSASVELGSSWYRSDQSALLLVPSVIVEEEFNVLINPRHRDSAGITATVVRQFEYNRLFRR